MLLMRCDKIRLSASLAMLTLTGCNLAPKYAPPTLAAPVAYNGMGPWTPAQPADNAPRGDWWHIYNDPVLDRLEQQVETGNPDLAIVLSRYDQARQYATQAAAAQYPFLGIGGSATQNRQSAERPLRETSGPDVYADDVLEGTFSYELDLWGRVRNQVAAGNDEAEASAYDAAALRLSLEAELADAYFNLRGLDAQEQLLTQTAAAYLRALQLTEAQHAGGIVSGLDVGRAQTQYETTRAADTDVIAARALYADEIASLVGVPAPSFSLPPDPALPAPPQVPVAAPSALLQRRPDVAAAERRAAEANAGIGVARAAFFPTITLDASGGFQDAGGGINLFNASNSLWSLGPSLALTLFNGGARRAAVRVALDQFNQAGEVYRSTALTAFQQVEDNLWLCNDLATESTQQADAVQAADHTADLAMSLYEGGAVTYLDVVTAQTADLDAQRTALTIATRRLVASVDLVRALGGGWTRAAGAG
jgi:NodT family efflux transporter outer membrane factor (OMF) lipoprotein